MFTGNVVLREIRSLKRRRQFDLNMTQEFGTIEDSKGGGKGTGSFRGVRVR
jgi:hypothetical protein